MTIGVLLKETMSGEMTIDHGKVSYPFSFSIEAFTPYITHIFTQRFFFGTVTLDQKSYPCRGELTIKLNGPHYWLTFMHPEWGQVRVEGKKEYGRNGLIRSLITCPMQVHAEGKNIGRAEVAYRDTMIGFPFKSLRLITEQQFTERLNAQ